MKTTYIKKLKSGNYEISSRNDYTEKFTTKKALNSFWNRVSGETSNVYDYHRRWFKPARIVKSRYSRSQSYFCQFEELYRAVK